MMSNESASPKRGNPKALRELKRQLRPKYLGKCGIHALGARTSEDAIGVYLSPGASGQQKALSDLREKVAPHNLIVVEEDAPRTG